MTANDRQDDERRTGDALDRVIDEAVEVALAAGPVDLRDKVMARLEGRAPAAEESPRVAWWLRPALLPAAGALLLVAGVALLWEHADQQLSSRPAPVASTSRPPSRPREAAPPQVAAAASSASPVPVAAKPGASDPRRRRAAMPDTRLYAASSLGMDAAGSGKVTPASLIPDADDAAAGPPLPGAPAGDLGDPIAPMPKPRPIVIQPLATQPIEVAPPVSTLGRPVGELADAAARDRQDPGKPGGK